jgi:hypothetical protein
MLENPKYTQFDLKIALFYTTRSWSCYKIAKILISLKICTLGGFPFKKHTAHALSKFIFKYIFHLLSIDDIYQFHLLDKWAHLFRSKNLCKI